MRIEKIKDKSLLVKYLVDRLAFGYSVEALVEDVKRELDVNASVSDILEIADLKKDEIEARKKEFLLESEDAKPDIIGLLDKAEYDMRLALDSLRDSGNLNAFFKAQAVYLRALELGAKLRGGLSDAPVVVGSVQLIQNNVLALKDIVGELIEKGVLKVVDLKLLDEELSEYGSIARVNEE